jgi:uncharacterized protein
MLQIWPEILAYNFVMFGLDLILGLFVWHRRTVAACLGAAVSTITLAAVVAALVGRVPFEALHLLCYGWFLHVPLILLVCAAAVWKSRRRWAGAGIAIAILLAAIAVDAFWIEPQWLEVTTVRLQSDKVSRPWRAVLIADLQTDQVSAYERRVFEAVQTARPDVVLMAGDYLQVRSESFPQLRDQFNAFLRQMDFHAPHGVYAVGGNSDTLGWQRIFAGVSVTSFVQSRSCLVDELRITGLSIVDSFDKRLQIDAESQFHIVLGHGPDFALGNIQADLLLAGHTHGGQVQLPLIGPLITLSQVPRAWASGLTRLDDRRHLFVSRGIGMERMGAPRLRFLCRPQLVILDIHPAASPSGPPGQDAQATANLSSD